MKKFERLRHIRYFTNSLQNLPKQYSSADTTRLTLAHFCVQALDILGCLPDADCCGKVEEEVYLFREEIIEWIYGLQTLPTKMRDDDDSSPCTDDDESELSAAGYVGGGFKGGTYLGPLPNASSSGENNDEDHHHHQSKSKEQHPYDHSHLAMTYVAICTLLTLGDDLSRLHKLAILQTLKSLQKEDGSFVAISSNNCNNNKATTSSSSAATEQQQHTHQPTVEKEDDDCDLRFMYLALATWHLLTDPPNNDKNNNNDHDSIINIQSATSYILSCISYDGSIGLTPGREGHGGSAFCGIASLHLMGVLPQVMARDDLRGWKEDILRWCVMRQSSLPKRKTDDGDEDDGNVSHNNGYYEEDNNAGMQGRPNKLQDTCYSYWIGGAMHILAESHLLDGWALREYVLLCQSPYGGFGKVVGVMPDLLHSFYSLSWLALSKEQGCCEEEYDENDDDGEMIVNAGDENRGKVGYDSEIRKQVYESMARLSEFDCALGICTKRKPAFQKAAMRDSD
mmetsp:Transcript_37008/g.64822  ORF Transcript_37008/g.64822 Transcript_37008/m.64822 type:complete len:510 (-) Transcript_37008:70-1599(-)|eukprot:CAMPEP_0201874364 /NCGR_PEP_ID=MMETSP0902-20130614/6646_1 /ASSEMBLY_ACC=CAM_ASM_000551 /TAXON_ID=420261 /ORGANISM="Thalassiosira antarctica, Strain CCMP982" /LENGTH=509 /DNA_ID=CAMNT_0048401221 /DNA_START=1 /DNA_END=1530 /DNA_ORIENTATION=-